jgi:thymidylate synthase ThyX
MGMTASQQTRFQRRIYPLDPREITEEELAVVFAMTSRRPEPFDQIREMVTAEKAADFHERWVVGYGHASVAEHAILHMAVENISRLACDTLEDNRLASYTEKSSRFQVLEQGAYYTPPELDAHPALRGLYTRTCDRLFDLYHALVERTREHLPSVRPRREGERDGAYNLRLRREAVDSCRFVLPAGSLTNVGVTINARSLEHAIRKLLSSDLQEEREIGELLKAEGRRITPTLIRYAERNDYLVLTREAQEGHSARAVPGEANAGGPGEIETRLVTHDSQAQARLVAGLLYHYSGQPYDEVWRRARAMSAAEQEGVVHAALEHLGPHDAPLRELELVDYTFEFLMDYGAYREFKRHRMQTYIPQPLTVHLGYVVPPLLREAGLGGVFREAMEASEAAFAGLAALSPMVAQYVVTHAHRRRLLSKMNLRECYHLFKLRTRPGAHFTIQDASRQALELVRGVHPLLVKYIQLRTD